jgi:putative FmdB family regulatory protein
MPIYDYLCSAGHRFEKIQKMSDAPPDSCPECGALVERQMATSALAFKGPGFYLTDYGRNAHRKRGSDG